LTYSIYFRNLGYKNIQFEPKDLDVFAEGDFSHSFWVSKPLSIASQENIKKLVEERVKTIQSRLEEIDKRFPSKDSVDKIAAVNNAILATNLEALSRSVSRIEENMLSKWDVAKIVFQILAIVGALVGLSITIIKFVAI